ncbi:hypothetical protein NC652_015153 [Populus alba x Populus x berolinensis]|nr:hypothetical protein NC652_015153 [Populus alba x Populus x berolinensis]
MLKFLSKVKIEFNALDPRVASCMEFLAQCNARKAKESNPACQVLVKRRTATISHHRSLSLSSTGVEEAFDATSTPAQAIRTMILEKGQLLETEQMFREAGEKWPVIIPEEELHQYAPGLDNLTSIVIFIHGSVLGKHLMSLEKLSRSIHESNRCCSLSIIVASRLSEKQDGLINKTAGYFMDGTGEFFSGHQMFLTYWVFANHPHWYSLFLLILLIKLLNS